MYQKPRSPCHLSIHERNAISERLNLTVNPQGPESLLVSVRNAKKEKLDLELG
jgi:Flp pilus assembly CpaF family ATPase